MYINHTAPRKGQDSDSLGRLQNLRLDNTATVGNYNILVVAIDQLHRFCKEETRCRIDGVRTARTKPQLATGPQKWVVLGPTGLFTNALNAVAMPANQYQIASVPERSRQTQQGIRVEISTGRRDPAIHRVRQADPPAWKDGEG